MDTSDNVVKGDTAHNNDSQNGADCSCCGLPIHGHSKPKVYKKRPPRDCANALPQLALAPKFKFRREVYALPGEANIPRRVFSECILGKRATTFWQQVRDDALDEMTRLLLKSIASITRDGRHVHVVYNVGALGTRWEATVLRREYRSIHPEVQFHSEQAEMARQLHRSMPQEYFKVKPRRQRRTRKVKQVM